MNLTDVTSLSRRLAEARKSGIPAARAECDLRRVGSLEEAEKVQALAALSFSRNEVGHCLAATTSQTARLLNCPGPIVGPLFDDARLPAGASVVVTRAMLGIGAQFLFAFGRSYPGSDESVDFATVATAIVACRLGLQVLARTSVDVPLNDWTGTADFGLADVTVEGSWIANWRERDLAGCEVELALDGHVCAVGRGDETLGHPLAPVVWLARRLRARGRAIEAGDTVAVGSCTAILQVTPGHTIQGRFGDLGKLTASLA